MALVLLAADPALLADHRPSIKALPGFPAELHPPLDERLRLHAMTWDELWRDFLDLGRRAMTGEGMTQAMVRRFHWFFLAMARHPRDGEQVVLDALRGQHRREVRGLMSYLEPTLVELAGWMRLEKAIPLLIRRIDEQEEMDVLDVVGPSLALIGTEPVVQAAARAWWDAGVDGRYSLCESLEYIHTDLAVERALAFLAEEEDVELAQSLGHCLLGQFDSRAIEPVRDLVLPLPPDSDDVLDAEQWDLRHRLVATAVIMDASFPEFEQWHADAVASNYGWTRNHDFRLGDNWRRIGEQA